MIDTITELTEGPDAILSDCTEKAKKLYLIAKQRFSYDLQYFISSERYYTVSSNKPVLYRGVLLEPGIIYSKERLCSLFEENEGKDVYV